jgi:4'-phosphopantetheinyl transferase
VHDVAFLIRSADELPATDEWMGADERARSQAMTFARRRADFRLGRFAAHELLSALFGPGEYDVRAAPDGAPEPWLGETRAAAAISISHRAGVALCAGTRAPLRLGADLELVETRSGSFAADYFTPAELARVAATAGAPARDECVTLIWSAKESAVKGLRQGLRLDTRSVEVREAASLAAEWAALEVAAGGELFTGYWRRYGALIATVVADAPFALRGALDPAR